MGVGKENMEVVNIDYIFLLLSMKIPPGEITVAAIPALPLKIDSDSLPVPMLHEDFSR